MAKKFLSPGQRRRRWIRGLLALSVVLITAGAWYIEGPGQRFAKAAIADKHKIVIDAEILHLREELVEYRNLKGRKRERFDYLADLRYTFNGETIEETRDVSMSVYLRHEQGDHLELWATGPKHNLIRIKDEVLADARRSPLARSLSAAIASGTGAFVLSLLLIPLFGREPDGYMPDGFYTDSSWLDIEDHQLIAIRDGQLIQYKFHKSLAGTVQKLYQTNAPLEQILALRKKGSQATHIPIDRIDHIEAKHYQDTFYVTWKPEEAKDDDDESASIEFLNPTVRDHALAILAPLTRARLQSRERRLTRVASARASLIVLALSLGVAWYVDQAVLLGITGFIGLLALKSVIARLWNPTILTELYRPEPAQA